MDKLRTKLCWQGYWLVTPKWCFLQDEATAPRLRPVGEADLDACIEKLGFPVIRLETPNAFYDYEAKYQATTTQYHCPCGLSDEQEQFIRDLAVTACKVVGVKGWGRVDVFIDDLGQYQLIEINTVPGMTDHSLVPMAARQAGMDFDELGGRILETSCG
jgi:D-alanine-D-alanine ligase